MPPDASEPRPFLEQVESFFMATVRQGLALRPGDVDVVRDWERRGVPFDVVRRGIADGVRRFLATAEPHQPLPGVLKYYRTFVESEFKAWQRARALGIGGAAVPRVVAPATDLAGRALGILAAWAANAPDGPTRTAYEHAAARIRERDPERPVGEVLEAVDDAIAAALVAGTPADAPWRAGMAAALEAARRRGVGTAALAEMERAEIRAAATEVAGYAGLVDACLADGGDGR